MAHIPLREDLPGIRGLMVFRPETAEPLNQLADILLRGSNTLSPGERELIAAFVSSRNDCFFCQSVHGAVAAYHLEGNEQLVRDVKLDPEHAAVPDKLKALLAIAGKVQRSGRR
jgi:AhpD family alkylhydroperoxidase